MQYIPKLIECHGVRLLPLSMATAEMLKSCRRRIRPDWPSLARRRSYEAKIMGSNPVSGIFFFF